MHLYRFWCNFIGSIIQTLFFISKYILAGEEKASELLTEEKKKRRDRRRGGQDTGEDSDDDDSEDDFVEVPEKSDFEAEAPEMDPLLGKQCVVELRKHEKCQGKNVPF